jgi:hypothetical protein
LKIYKFLDIFFRSSDLRVYKSILTINDLSVSYSERKFYKDRIYFLLYLFGFPFFLKFRFNNTITNNSVLIEPSGSSEHINIYKHYIRKNFRDSPVQFEFRKSIILINSRDVASLFKLYYKIFCLLPYFFSFKRIPFFEFVKTFIIEHNLNVFKSIKIIYVVDYSSISNYLFILRNNHLFKITYIPTNSSITNYFRFIYLNNISLCCTSPKIAEEINVLVKKKFLRFENIKIVKTGPLFDMYQNNIDTKSFYDIAFYSSGEWARYGGLYRLDRFSKIKDAICRGNIYNDKAEEILFFLTDYVKLNNLKLKIYMHPYETYIWKSFNLKPPFIKLVDNVNVFVSSENSTYSNLFESRLGIITISSVLFDRESYGLGSLYFLENPRNNSTVFYKIGQFENESNGFFDLASLKAKLDNFF